MPYLVLAVDGDLITERTRRFSDAADYGLVRAALTRCFPGWEVASPLDPFPDGGLVVGVWTSTERTGERNGGSFHEWAIGPALKVELRCEDCGDVHVVPDAARPTRCTSCGSYDLHET